MTTIISIRRNNKVAMGSDGQVTLASCVVKEDASKIRRLFDEKVLAGFAGAAADSFALLERFEEMLKKYQGGLQRAAVELAKEWRTDKRLRKLESLLAVSDKTTSLIISGSGDVIEPSDGIIGIGSGGGYALAVARALISNTNLSAKQIAQESLKIASHICIYTNENLYIEEI